MWTQSHLAPGSYFGLTHSYIYLYPIIYAVHIICLITFLGILCYDLYTFVTRMAWYIVTTFTILIKVSFFMLNIDMGFLFLFCDWSVKLMNHICSLLMLRANKRAAVDHSAETHGPSSCFLWHLVLYLSPVYVLIFLNVIISLCMTAPLCHIWPVSYSIPVLKGNLSKQHRYESIKVSEYLWCLWTLHDDTMIEVVDSEHVLLSCVNNDVKYSIFGMFYLKTYNWFL